MRRWQRQTEAQRKAERTALARRVVALHQQEQREQERARLVARILELERRARGGQLSFGSEPPRLRGRAVVAGDTVRLSIFPQGG